MALIEWREDFSVGVPEVDHEHRELIELINQAHAELGGGVSGAALSAEALPHDSAAEFLGEIHARIAGHFALEEKVMRAARYDHLGRHKAAHEILLDDIREFMDACETGQALDQAAFGARLADWFGEHFRTEDAHLHGRLG
jgi:hemerythrin-like metal-binding protein